MTSPASEYVTSYNMTRCGLKCNFITYYILKYQIQLLFTLNYCITTSISMNPQKLFLIRCIYKLYKQLMTR